MTSDEAGINANYCCMIITEYLLKSVKIKKAAEHGSVFLQAQNSIEMETRGSEVQSHVQLQSLRRGQLGGYLALKLPA